MKNAILLLFIATIIVPTVYSDENIQNFYFKSQINVKDLTVNSTGQVCYNCICNLSLFNIDNSFNSSYIMDNNNNGFYNATLPNLAVNKNNTFYPISISCNDGTSYGTSSINGIRVVYDMIDFTALTILLVSLIGLFSYLAIGLEPTDPIKVWMKWVFIFGSLFALFGGMFMGNIIADYYALEGLAQFFVTMMWLVGSSIIIALFGLVIHILFVQTLNPMIKQNE